MPKKIKAKKRALLREANCQSEKVEVDVPIANLPEKFLRMDVNSGTKIRNVLNYALKEFPNHQSVVWSGAGQGIGKVITCAEILKKKNPGLNQITKLRYIKSKNTDEGKEASSEIRLVPEIHILLSKDSLNSDEPGYQSSINDQGSSSLFSSRRSLIPSDKSVVENFQENLIKKDKYKQGGRGSRQRGRGVGRRGGGPSTSKLSDVTTIQFASMDLKMGQKRSHPRGGGNARKNFNDKKRRKQGKN